MKIPFVFLAMVLAGCGPTMYKDCVVTDVATYEDSTGVRYDVTIVGSDSLDTRLLGLSEAQNAEFGKVGAKYHGTLKDNYCK